VAYLLDADVFITAKNLHYGFDFCPAFWEWLIEQHKAGHVFSIEKVGGEILGLGDDLSTWAAARGDDFFLKPDPGVVPSLAAVSAWANNQQYEPAAINTFLRIADYYLVSQAHAGGHTVVTHEVPSPSTKKIKIPNACIGLGIKCVTPFEMLRTERARFVLGQQ
jgi:Domain of unknown function (DUF4411)